MRQHIDTDAERLQFSHALEDFGRDTDLMQAESQRQSANSSACNKNGHVALYDRRHDTRSATGQLRKMAGCQTSGCPPHRSCISLQKLRRQNGTLPRAM
jgi:hypothetical protein